MTPTHTLTYTYKIEKRHTKKNRKSKWKSCGNKIGKIISDERHWYMDAFFFIIFYIIPTHTHIQNGTFNTFFLSVFFFSSFILWWCWKLRVIFFSFHIFIPHILFCASQLFFERICVKYVSRKTISIPYYEDIGDRVWYSRMGRGARNENEDV